MLSKVTFSKSVLFSVLRLLVISLILAVSVSAQTKRCEISNPDNYWPSCDEGYPQACFLAAAVTNREHEFAECLIEKGYSPNLPSGQHSGLSIPVIAAAWYRDIRFLEILLKGKANLETKDRQFGMTALMWTNKFITDPKKARGDTLETMLFLIKHNADVNTSDNEGQTPLMLNSYIGRYEFVRVLLENGAKVNLQKLDGMTALMMSDDDGPVVSALLAAGADKEIKDNKGRTAVLHAISKCQPDKLRILVEGGAKTDVTDKAGLGVSDYLQKLPDTSECRLISSLPFWNQ